MILAIEGIDGSGKTEVSQRVAELLRRRQTTYQVAWAAFPNRQSPTGKIIERYLRGRTRELDAYAHQALQVVNRLELLPDLKRPDRLTVCARYQASGHVYGRLDGLPTAWLERVHAALPPPDLEVLLVVDPEVAARRISRRFTEPELYERGLELYRAASQGFVLYFSEPAPVGTSRLRLSSDDPARSPEALAEQITEFFLTMFSCRCGRLHNAVLTPCLEKSHEEEE